MKIAIIHDYLNQSGGAERVLEAFLEIWPNADVYTLIYDRTKISENLRKVEINKSFLNFFPFSQFYYEYLIPFFPSAIEKIDTRKYDMVITSSSAWAKGAITNIHTFHLCYCYNPMRFAWDSYFPYAKQKGFVYKTLNLIISFLRIWDYTSAQRPDKYITISKFVKKRIKKYYGIDADIVYPPVNTDFFIPAQNKRQEDFFIIVSRLKPYKKIEIAIEAFNKLSLPLIVIGEGSIKNDLKKISKSNIHFLNNIDDKTLLSYYQRCKAFIFPSEEDFGIVPLEAQSCGKPVIAYKGGGALETVIEGETGEFFYPQNSDALVEAVKKFSPSKYDSSKIRENALRFSMNIFKKEFEDKVLKYYEEYKIWLKK